MGGNSLDSFQYIGDVPWAQPRVRGRVAGIISILKATLDEVLHKMQAFNNYAITNCERSHLERIVPALARCITELDFEILEPVYKEYPELKPAFLP